MNLNQSRVSRFVREDLKILQSTENPVKIVMPIKQGMINHDRKYLKYITSGFPPVIQAMGVRSRDTHRRASLSNKEKH